MDNSPLQISSSPSCPQPPSYTWAHYGPAATSCSHFGLNTSWPSLLMCSSDQLPNRECTTAGCPIRARQVCTEEGPGGVCMTPAPSRQAAKIPIGQNPASGLLVNVTLRVNFLFLWLLLDLAGIIAIIAISVAQLLFAGKGWDRQASSGYSLPLVPFGIKAFAFFLQL